MRAYLPFFQHAAVAPAASVSTEKVRQRVVFIDLARVAAILLMMQGHTVDALLASEYRTTAVFHAWSFARGLTSCLFFFVAGFAFVLASYTQAGRRRAAASPRRRFHRLALFLVLGYALHSPSAGLGGLRTLTGPQWSAFLAVDALQCVAVMLAVLQLLALSSATSRTFLMLTLPLVVAVVTITPAIWRVDWGPVLPASLAGYLTSADGSLFPLFPWGGYVLLGGAIGALYVDAKHPARIATSALGTIGIAMAIGSVVGAAAPWEPLGPTAYWSTSPNQFLLRAGLVCSSVAMLACVSRGMQRLPAVLNSLAQHSLLVYAVHLCIVYGSAWNHGLRHWYGHALTPARAVVVVIMVWGFMIGLAHCWHACTTLRNLHLTQRISHAFAARRLERLTTP